VRLPIPKAAHGHLFTIAAPAVCGDTICPCHATRNDRDQVIALPGSYTAAQLASHIAAHAELWAPQRRRGLTG
jgi:hypothetical protein